MKSKLAAVFRSASLAIIVAWSGSAVLAASHTAELAVSAVVLPACNVAVQSPVTVRVNCETPEAFSIAFNGNAPRAASARQLAVADRNTDSSSALTVVVTF